MAVSDSMTVTLDAPAEKVIAFLRDIDNQSNWFPGNLESEVLERDADGNVTSARLVNDVKKVTKDEFVLAYTHNPDGFSWTMPKPSTAQKTNDGSWKVVDKGGKTEATLTLTIDTSLPLPGFMQKGILKDTLKGATSALTKQTF